MITPYIVKDDRLQEKRYTENSEDSTATPSDEIVNALLVLHIVTGFDCQRIHDYFASA